MTLMQLPLIMARALILTVLVECLAAWCMGVRSRHDQIVVVLVNLMTNPLLVSLSAAAVVWLGYGAKLPATIILEAAAVIAEGFVYKNRLEAECDPFLLSIVCNASSFTIGEILNRFVF